MNEGMVLVERGRGRHRLGAEELLELGRSGAPAAADRRPFLNRAARPLGQAGSTEVKVALFAIAALAFGAAVAI